MRIFKKERTKLDFSLLHLPLFCFLQIAYKTTTTQANESFCGAKNDLKCGYHSGFIKDSLDSGFGDVDKDGSSYWTKEEIIENLKTSETYILGDRKDAEIASVYLRYLDDNSDGVLDIYELRFGLHHVSNSALKESLEKFNGDHVFINWLKSFYGEASEIYPFYLVKLFQLFDEDINGKLTWKEIQICIKMAKLFNASLSKEPLITDEDLASIKVEYSQKWMSLKELSNLLSKLGVESDSHFYNWTLQFLSGNSEFESPILVKDWTRKEFKEHDADSNGVISKGELIAILHQHRKDYYTEERINRRWARADRNQDGQITLNEYAFLENLKHPEKN